MIKSTTALKKFVSVAADKGMAPREYRGEIISAPLTALAEFIGNIECGLAAGRRTTSRKAASAFDQ
jgi:hypothetical protein